jgi:hypothetical protein
MSVTISVMDEPVVVDDDGYEYREHDINFANTNFCDLMRSLNRHQDAKKMYGKWSVEELPGILESVRKLKNIEKGFEKETTREGNIVYCGRDHLYVQQKLGSLCKTLEAAIKRGKEITFA